MLRCDLAVNGRANDRRGPSLFEAVETPEATTVGDPRGFERAIWAFVGLGIFLRVTRYLLNFPLWHDEAFVAVNFIDRGYLAMMGRLEYSQVCPLLFLWIELTVVRLLGFSEWSLRLFPTVCAVLSVWLFWHVATRLLVGWPRLLAVAVFAVSYYPIRHGAEVKPYASDLLVALGLLALAIEWRQAPGRSLWLWVLAGCAPLALLLSHPSVFVAGGIGLAILPAAWRSGRWRVRGAYLAFGMALTATFLGLLIGYTGTPESEELRQHYLMNYWVDSFPPMESLWALGSWLFRMHAGTMLAYPIGGENGASLLTLVGVATGAIWLGRRGSWTVLAMLLLPFGMGLVAAFLGRYPYGGAARIMQYLAPSICLLAGLGASALLSRIGSEPKRHRVSIGIVAVLALLGVGQFAKALVAPYHIESSARAREFARWFWVEQSREAEVACLKTDFGRRVEPHQWKAGISAEYLCNRQIYAPRKVTPKWEPTALEPLADRPLRCVLYHVHWFDPPESKPEFLDWLQAMTSRYDLQSRESYTVNAGQGLESWKEETYIVFEFAARSGSMD
ncbi:hypothetical protein BH23PLA1_BH23PLA1_25550 [soil metagenome]